MALPSSGAITFANIQTEFGGSNPISLSEYYAGGSYVPAGTSGTNGAVPSSGAISVNKFYGTTKAVAPVNTVAPAVSGTAAIGNTLSCSTGTWTGIPTPTYSYQWQKGTTNISGATSSTYTVQLSDAGSTLRCVVTATNTAGSTAANSASTSAVAPAIGQSYGGGYYAGKIVQGGTTYYLIVAPKSSGQNTDNQWKTTNTAGPTATQTLNNGPAASSSMNSSTYPAAYFCEGLSIGGYTDWYLPARDELELCYRNLKPTTDANSTSARPKSSYTYPEGNDVSGDTMGINRNSSPTGSAYTSSVPAQTSVTAFKSGGTEAFSAGSYWSSSESDSAGAWRHDFYSGYQGPSLKDNYVISPYARAVRRVAV